MTKSARSPGRLTAAETAAKARAEKRLARIGARGSPAMIVDAIAECAPVVAAAFGAVNSAATSMVLGHAARIPFAVHEAWMTTPYEHITRALASILAARDGDFWLAGDLAPSVQTNLPVLNHLESHGLGEIGNYKITQRPAPAGGTQHHWLALITARDARFSRRAPVVLGALAPAIRAAALRISLPLVAMSPLLAQLVEESSLGYAVLGAGGEICETNRPAHELARRYGEAADAPKSNRMLADLVALAQRRGPLLIERDGKLLEVRAHALAAAIHGLPEDMTLLTLREQAGVASRAQRRLPPGRLSLRRREVADLLVNTGLTYELIAARLRVKPGTIRTHVSHIYQAYDVHNRGALVALCNNPAMTRKKFP